LRKRHTWQRQPELAGFLLGQLFLVPLQPNQHDMFNQAAKISSAAAVFPGVEFCAFAPI
jgi:hypothetical protein